jgi:hypothetical protein
MVTAKFLVYTDRKKHGWEEERREKKESRFTFHVRGWVKQ